MTRALGLRVLAVQATIVAMMLVPTVAQAHVPWVEPGNGTGPYQLPVPDVSRAIYGRVTGAPDVFTFSVGHAVTTRMDLLVPARPSLRSFVPIATVEGGGARWQAGPAQLPRTRFLEPFSLATFWESGSAELQLKPGVSYTMRIQGSGTEQSGQYVVAFGGGEAFSSDDIRETFAVLPTIWLGTWGGGPVRGIAWVVLLAIVLSIAAFALWLRRRSTSRASRARP